MADTGSSFEQGRVVTSVQEQADDISLRYNGSMQLDRDKESDRRRGKRPEESGERYKKTWEEYPA